MLAASARIAAQVKDEPAPNHDNSTGVANAGLLDVKQEGKPETNVKTEVKEEPAEDGSHLPPSPPPDFDFLKNNQTYGFYSI